MQWNKGKSIETETTTWLEFLDRRKANVEQILVSEDRNKSEKAVLLEPKPGIQVGKLTIWVGSFKIKIV